MVLLPFMVPRISNMESRSLWSTKIDIALRIILLADGKEREVG